MQQNYFADGNSEVTVQKYQKWIRHLETVHNNLFLAALEAANRVF